ncbi:MAG: PIN domain-containing protein, partial [Dolichospermum sp.]
YLLDTNTCIIYLKGKNIHLKEKLDSISISEIAVCSIVKSELFYGAMRSAKPESNLKLQQGFLDKFVSLPFNDEAAIIFGNIRAELTSKGTPIGGYDLQIAAIALANNLILVTPHMNRNFIFLTIQYYLT